jgi:hypothetical protein
MRTCRRKPGQDGEKLFLPQKILHPRLLTYPGQAKGILVRDILHMIEIEGYAKSIHPFLPQDP